MMAPAEAALFYDSYEEYEQKREPSAAEFGRKEEKERQSAARQLALVEEYLRPGDTLCDIGASYGHFLRLARHKVSGLVAVVFGATLAASFVSTARPLLTSATPLRVPSSPIARLG
jgi:cyclopropane fatty-acyl-phospholipid synthase-like methyltransferase